MIKEFDKNGRFFLKYIGNIHGYIGVINYKGTILIPMSASNREKCKYYPIDNLNKVDVSATPVTFISKEMKQLEQHQHEADQYYARTK